MGGVKSRTFTWPFDCPVDKIWPILADTERFNEAAQLPKHKIEEHPNDDGSIDFVGEAKFGPYTLIWDEEPTNWVVNRWFSHRRNFRNGPFRFLCATLKMFPEKDGCRAEYTIDVEAANPVGRLMLATSFFSSTEKNFGRLVANANDFCAGKKEKAFDIPPPRLPAGAQEKLRHAISEIEATPYGHGLSGRLAHYISTSQEIDVRKIRPLHLSRIWNVPERHVIELCMQAARSGILGMRWDILCPRCQIAKSSSLALDKLPDGAHCDTCNIDYGRDYAANVELAFFPNSLVRPVDDLEFCLFGPWTTPHVNVQITVAAGETRAVEASLSHGVYRLRTLEAGDEEILEWKTGAFPDVVAKGKTIASAPASQKGKLVLENKTGRPLTFIIEELAWRRDALNAHRATTFQAFRDLYDTEILRPGDNLEVDNITTMFTDLEGSTALYESAGDFQAYSLVRDFFAVLGGAIRENNGTMVKTIGDAVHGAFANPRDALLAAIQIQADIDGFNAKSGRTPIGVKIGLHAGRCIAVTLNNRLDYYGSAINKTARLADRSGGGDIVLSEEFAAEPAAGPELKKFRLKKDSAALKGFDDPMPFLRIPTTELKKKRRRRV